MPTLGSRLLRVLGKLKTKKLTLGAPNRSREASIAWRATDPREENGARIRKMRVLRKRVLLSAKRWVWVRFEHRTKK